MSAPAGVPIRRNDRTRKRILQAAMELFGRDGFDGTSVRAIAERCALTDPAVYYYFKSKRAILDELWGLPSPLEELRSPAPTLRSADQVLDESTLMDLVDWMLNGAAKQDALNRILMRSVLDGDETALAVREAKRVHWRKTLAPYFLTVFPPEESAVRLDAAMMLALGFVYTAQIDHGTNFPAVAAESEFRDHLKALILMAVALPARGVA
ncbi:MAG: helix-turn-helix domain-containing protein [Tepidiformaceae bacterium]